MHVWVAGHSPGAAIGLMANRNLALDRSHILGASLLHSPQRLNRHSPRESSERLERSAHMGARERETKERIQRAAVRLMGKGVCSLGENVGLEYIRWSWYRRVRRRLLQGESFVCESEGPICSAYKIEFKKYGTAVSANSGASPAIASTSTAAPSLRKGPVKMLRMDSRNSHLMPAAVLYVNHTRELFPESHELHQWCSFPCKDLNVYNYTA